MTTYRTIDLAREAGLHVNTIRFYEEISFLTKPRRAPNNYRVYTDLQLEQVKFVRLALRAEVLQGGLRKQVIRILRLCADCHFEEALRQTERYTAMLTRGIDLAVRAVDSVEAMLRQNEPPAIPPLTRREAARALDITVDTLRNWELNGLVPIRRMQDGYRIYDGTDLERLSILRTLRLANYSLSAILHVMNRLSGAEEFSVLETLNIPDSGDDIRSVCDHLLDALKSAKADALEMPALLKRIENFATLQ